MNQFFYLFASAIGPKQQLKITKYYIDRNYNSRWPWYAFPARSWRQYKAKNIDNQCQVVATP